MNAAALIRSVRLRAHLTQSVLSTLSGVTQSALSQIENGESSPNWATVERILKSSGSSLVVIPTRRSDVSTVSLQIGSALAGGDTLAAVRHFIQLNDDLTAEHGATRFALTISEPVPTNSKRWDAAIAALVDHRLGEEQLPTPDWVYSPSRRLAKSWTFGAGHYVVSVPRENVPAAFLDHGVLIDRETLESV